MKKISKLGLSLVAINSALAVFFCFQGAGNGFGMIPIMLIDFPASLIALTVGKFILMPTSNSPLLQFIVFAGSFVFFGGLQWYGIGLLISILQHRLFPKMNPKKMGTIVVLLFVGALVLFFTNIGNGLLGTFTNSIKGDPVVPAINEIVMPPNATITATTDSGAITIKSGKGLKRYYTWDGATRSVVMGPRPERWYGSFGIYYPSPGSHWLPVNGVTRGVLQEGQQNFDTIEDAEVWLKKDCEHCVYNDSGLVVSFLKIPGNDQIDVDVWQIRIGGKTPSPYKESTFRTEHSREQTQAAKDFEARYRRNYYTDGEKPIKLRGSNNSAIKTSWDNSK